MHIHISQNHVSTQLNMLKRKQKQQRQQQQQPEAHLSSTLLWWWSIFYYNGKLIKLIAYSRANTPNNICASYQIKSIDRLSKYTQILFILFYFIFVFVLRVGILCTDIRKCVYFWGSHKYLEWPPKQKPNIAKLFYIFKLNWKFLM